MEKEDANVGSLGPKFGSKIWDPNHYVWMKDTEFHTCFRFCLGS